MKTCHQCNHQNPDQAQFCNNCGARISEQDKPQTTGSAQAERRQLTILFCDLVGSTAISETLDPEDFRQLILDYHEVAEHVIKRYSGHVGNYLGDGLLIYFGYPIGLEDAARVGIKAGMEIIDAVAKANKEWVKKGRPEVSIRIGVHTGLVVVDDHLALGETVNVAARIEGLAPENGIAVSPATLQLIKGWYEVKSLGKQQLKGITEPMEVYQVIGESGAKTPLDVAKSKGLSPLVGRSQELALMERNWGEARQGKARKLILVGEAGIGKSRLVDAAKLMVEDDGVGSLLEARCSAYQRNTAFYPVLEMLKQSIFFFDSQDDSDQMLAKLETYFVQHKMDIETMLPLFAEYLGINSENVAPLIMSPFAKRQRFMEALNQVLFNTVADGPVFFVFEDLHWADASTLEWLRLFIANLTDKPMLLLCTSRPEIQPGWEENYGMNEVVLQRLDMQDLSDICEYQSKGKILPEEIVQQIADKTEGVPLFVEELTKMILESDLLDEGEERYELRGEIKSMTIPSTLQDSLLARLDRLSDTKEVVQLGSVLGREFTPEILLELLAIDRSSLDRSLDKLLKAEILNRSTDNSEVFQFRHALIRDAAYESLLKKRRQQLHSEVAEMLESKFAQISGSQPELVAHHYSEAGLPLSAIPLWLRAGQLASQKNAMQEAHAHLERGLALLHFIEDEQERNNLELDFRLTQGGAYVVSHGFPHAKVKETFSRARALAQTLDVSPKLALVLFNLLSYSLNTEDYEAHGELASYMSELAKDPDHGYWFDLFASQLVGGAGIVKGELAKANQSYTHLLEIFDPSIPFPWELCPSGYIEAGAKGWQMFCLQLLGQMDKAKRLAEAHLNFAEAHKDSMTLYHTYTFPALYNMAAREWKKAEQQIIDYLPIVQNFGDPVFNLTAMVYLNISRAYQDDDSAFEETMKLINMCFEIGFKAFAVTMSGFIAQLYYDRGDYDGCLNWIERILSHVNETGSHINTAELYRLKAQTILAQGGTDEEVEALFEKALDLADSQGALVFKLRSAVAIADYLEAKERVDEAYELLNSVYCEFTEGHDSVDLSEAKLKMEELLNVA